jgi:chitin disaccharide deacetylase
MTTLRWLSVILLSVASSLPAQTRTVAERLGYPRDAKLLILHADDLGFTHSADAASFDALDKGVISSASIMVPTPWITEVAAYARAHPDADLGLHLTLTAEWETYRWGSVESKDKVPSLLDPDGTFPNEDSVVAVRAKQAEIELELRAQIRRAMALGIRPTHLDSHMGSLFTTPALLTVYVKIAHEYHLPFLALRNNPFGGPPMPLEPNDIPLDALIQAFEDGPADKWKAFYLNAIASLKPGLTEIIVHLGYDDAELQAVTVNHAPWGSAWRQRDYNVVNSPEFKKALQDNKVILIKWRDLQKLVQP